MVPAQRPGPVAKVACVLVQARQLLSAAVQLGRLVARDGSGQAAALDVQFGERLHRLSVQRPGLAALLLPGPGQPLGRLRRVGRDDVDVALVACPAHGHVGQFTATAVLEGVGDVHGGTLGPMGRDGVSVPELVGT